MRRIALSTICALGLTAGASAANEISDGEIIIQNVSKETVLQFELVEWPRDVGFITVRIVGPILEKERGGPVYDALIKAGDRLPPIDLKEFGELIDGPYGFEITGTTGERIEVDGKRNDGRDKPATAEFVPFRLAGKFLVDGGQIISFEQFEEKETEGSKPGETTDDGDEGVKQDGPSLSKGREDTGRDRVIDGDGKDG